MVVAANEEEFDYDNSSLDASAPDVASSKGSKITLIAVSAILISFVLYFLFFNNNQNVENVELQPVENQQNISSEAPAESISSEELDDIFGKAEETKEEEDIILEEPEIPEIPALPEVPQAENLESLPTFLDIEEEPLEQVLTQQNNNQTVSINDAMNNSVNNPQNPEIGNINTPQSIIVVAGAPGPTNSVGYEKNIIDLTGNAIDQLEIAEAGVTSKRISDKTTTLVQGKIINAILETAINTEFPGDVRGIISRNVYAESGNNILIPRGSRIYGNYSSNILRGQARVNISWTRLIRPDGVVADVTINAADQFGRAGIEGDVDNRYGSVIANSLLTSVLAVGGAIAAEKLSGGDSSTTTTDATSGTTTTTSTASTQAITDVTGTIVDTVSTIINDTMDTQPVIRVPQGTRVTIVINSDIELPAYSKNGSKINLHLVSDSMVKL